MIKFVSFLSQYIFIFRHTYKCFNTSNLYRPSSFPLICADFILLWFYYSFFSCKSLNPFRMYSSSLCEKKMSSIMSFPCVSPFIPRVITDNPSFPPRFESHTVWQEGSLGFHRTAISIHQDQILFCLHQKPIHPGTNRLSVVDWCIMLVYSHLVYLFRENICFT